MVGASGVLGRAMLLHLAGHEVTGTTRTVAKLDGLRAAGARGVVCDVYAPGALLEVARTARAELVVNLLTDLSGGVGPGNTRVRREGGPVVVAAAQACGARRLAVESVAFELTGDAGTAVAELERGARVSGLEALVLRFGLLWGPGTWYAEPPKGPAVNVLEAGRRAAGLVLGARAGTYEIVG